MENHTPTNDTQTLPKPPSTRPLATLTTPRKTMRAILDSGSTKGLILLPTLIGLLSAPKVALSTLSLKTITADYVALIWIASILLSVLSYWMYVYVYGAVYRWIASWFGGTATNRDARLALAWTQVPFICIALVYLPIQLIYRADLYPEVDLSTTTAMISSLERTTAYYWITTIVLIPNLLAYIISLNLLAEACRFSAWKAFGVKIIAVLLHIPLFFVAGIVAIPASIAFIYLTN